DLSVDDADAVALFGVYALDERFGRVDGIVQRHDIAVPRIADAIDGVIDDQAILVFERRRHAQAFHARDLEAEGDDQDGVHRRGDQRLDPRHDLFLNL